MTGFFTHLAFFLALMLGCHFLWLVIKTGVVSSNNDNEKVKHLMLYAQKSVFVTSFAEANNRMDIYISDKICYQYMFFIKKLKQSFMLMLWFSKIIELYQIFESEVFSVCCFIALK